MIPNKMQVKVFAPHLDARLLPEIVPVFHRWITERALGEVLIDVADYRHVFQGPGITLIGHESTYHLDESCEPKPQGMSHGQAAGSNTSVPKSNYGLVCFRKRGFANVDAPLVDVLWRAFTACQLLERELSLVDNLFDGGWLKVSIADRTALPPLFAMNEFAGFIAARLSPLYGGPPSVEVVEGGLPGVRVRSDKMHRVSSLLPRLERLLHPPRR
jgi:hypothetical protein